MLCENQDIYYFILAIHVNTIELFWIVKRLSTEFKIKSPLRCRWFLFGLV